MTQSDTPGAVTPVLLVAGQVERLERLLGELCATGIAARLVRPDAPDVEPFRSARMNASVATARVLAHEFANYITTIRTFAHVLADEVPAGSDARADLDAIVRTLESGESFLAVLRAYVNPVRLGDHETDLNALLRRLEPEMRNPLPPGAALEVRAPATPLLVRGDEKRLRWLALELTTSAGIIAGATGHVTVSTASTMGSATACVVAECGGAGLPPDRMARIFEPFVVDRSAEGGMRLSTLYAAVTASGGEIDAEPTPDGGLAIRAWLPVAGGRNGEPGGNA